MPNSNDVASVEMLWERVLSLLVVGASVLGGSAVLLIQALPPILHGFPSAPRNGEKLADGSLIQVLKPWTTDLGEIHVRPNALDLESDAKSIFRNTWSRLLVE